MRALEEDTSVNAVLREYLEEYAGGTEKVREGIDEADEVAGAATEQQRVARATVDDIKGSIRELQALAPENPGPERPSRRSREASATSRARTRIFGSERRASTTRRAGPTSYSTRSTTTPRAG
jgi:hypothetical protein